MAKHVSASSRVTGRSSRLVSCEGRLSSSSSGPESAARSGPGGRALSRAEGRPVGSASNGAILLIEERADAVMVTADEGPVCDSGILGRNR